MASSDDSEDSAEDGPIYSGIIQPPLIKQLKKILDEYPDDGQILKEIIQNAEDAEASQMKILYDERCVNPDDGTKGKPFRKYFKGPALCVYNNAQFTQDDWIGIQMINSSVKEFDPVKIGRFGLGFKSVFHITDFPMIVSGNQMLVLDPHQKQGDRVCINMKLNRMDTYIKHLDVSYCLNALEGLFGFSKKTLTSGDFKGTLFRFPLRNQQTALSDNVYDKKMIFDLFNAFKAEASVELLFLKCLERIDLYISDVNEIDFSVEISDCCLNEVREKRSEFHSHMKSVRLKPAAETFTVSFNMEIVSQDKDGVGTANNWFVLHCLKGGKMSRDLETLCQDDSLSYSPHVSIAIPAENNTEFKGHVFCLLPLPLEDKSMTGFPVHVNGYFALSQNRRHVKWPTADQERNKAHTDKSIQWNKCLVVEVLAEVYFNVLQQLIQLYKENSTWEVMDIYRAIPDHRKITSHWDLISGPLFEFVLNFPILYTENNGGKWIRPEQAVFNIFEGHVTSEVKDTILELMKQLNIDMVCVPDHVTSVIKDRKINMQTLTLDFITRCLQENDSYRKLPFEKKLYLLSYLMSEGNYSKRLKGLELLPLNNGTFSIYGDRNHDKKVIICQEEVDIFPGQEDIFVNREIQDSIYDCLFQLAKSRLYQLFVLDDVPVNEIAYLLNKVIQTYIGTTAERVLFWNQSSKMVTGTKWLEQVWKFLQKYNLDSFNHLHLIHGINQLYKVSTLFLLRSSIGCSDIPSSVCKCLEYLDIVVLESLPTNILSHKNIKNFVGLPTTENVFRMLEKVQTGGYAAQMIQKFNSSVSCEERLQFVNYISGKTNLNANLVSLFSMMNLFVEKNSRRNVSVNKVRIIAETDDLPVGYFKESIDCTDIQFRNLALLLHVKVIKKEEVILEILECMRSGTQYKLHDQMNMMGFVLKNLSFFRLKNQMVDIAKDIRFIYNEYKQVKKAPELFDPIDERLQLIVLDRSQFPNIQDLPVDVKMLRKLGLKTICNLTALDVLNCAKYIQNNSSSLTESIRSAKLLEVLQGNTGLLYRDVEGYQLFKHLYNINFIIPSQRPSDFPDLLPWYTESSSYCRPSDLVNPKYRKLIGSVKPIFQSTMSLDLTKCFNWDKTPDIQDVIKQLLIITEKYEENFKPDLLCIIDDIYRFLAERCDDISSFQNLQNQKWIFTENGFQMPDKVYLHSTQSDISLKPYLFRLAPEFQKQPLLEMFRKMNCADSQDAKLLIKVQEMVREEYVNSGKTETRVRADLQLVINILNILKKEPNDNDELSCVLFPVEQSDNSRVVLMPAKECAYSKDGDDLYEDELYFVHQDIPPDTADILGVPSVTDTLLNDAERLQEWGQNEPLTRRIKDLLKAYKDGLSVPKEIIQNADDAGATKVCFMYDERGPEQYGRKLFDKKMFECLGPALWAYNDAKFTDDDLQNITKVSGATKEADTGKIGKFGLGFCSVYNLTEVPSFLTGDQMVIFDPHFDYLGVALKRKKQPGLKIHMQKNRKIVERKFSQFEPFNGVFGCNLNTQQSLICFNGTLFRLPLRTKQQAASSEISNVPYDDEQMKFLIELFIGAGGNLLFFTQNVTEIAFYHLPKGEKDPRNAVLLYSVTRKVLRTIEQPLSSQTSDTCTVLQTISANLKNVKCGKMKHLPEIKFSHLLELCVNVHSSLAKFGLSGTSSVTLWLVTWASGTEASRNLSLNSSFKGVVPLASVACPVVCLKNDLFQTCDLKQLPFGYYNNSHVFCYLPLPVETPFPVHINGSFAVTSDRRHLSCKTTDDKHSLESEWNEALMSDAVCNAYMAFLENLQILKIDPNEEYFKRWPIINIMDLHDKIFHKLQLSFYQTIANESKLAKVFRRNETIYSIQHCKFLDPTLMESAVGSIAFDICVKMLDSNHTNLMKLPNAVKGCFEFSKCGSIIEKKIITTVMFYSELVFPNLQHNIWDEQMKDALVLYALDNSTEDMIKLLQTNACIPTEPKRRLRRPCEIVDKNGQLNGLFSLEEERFVVDKENSFTDPRRHKTLSNIGMIVNKLSDDLVIDRANAIPKLSAVCSKCALDRCTLFVAYLNKEFENIKQNKQLVAKLKSIKCFPVKRKPDYWKWTWGGDGIQNKEEINGPEYICNNKQHKDIQVQFEYPSKLYLQCVENLICSVNAIFDKSCLPPDVSSDFFTEFGIIGDIDLAPVLANLRSISEAVSQNANSTDDDQVLHNTTFTMYQFINNFSLQYQNDEKRAKTLSKLGLRYQNEQIILLNGTFVKPCQIVAYSSEDCSPLLYRLNSAEHLKKLKGLLQMFQIESRCSSQRVLSILHTFREQCGSATMTDDNIHLYVKLLKVLVDSLEMPVPAGLFEELYIPDSNGILNPIHKLCLDDIAIDSTDTMLFTHPSISPEIAVPLGVNTKRKQKVKERSRPVNIYSKNFGQHEELVTRINRILSGYPCDSGILKELVQNADDAKATEVHIVLDMASYSKKNLFAETWEPLQGPALLVYNNSCFSEADLQGIQSIGLGSKGDDPTKTGQYGVGFNAVYQLTDVPSFLTRGPDIETGETLCVMDPQCLFVPDATPRCPGRQYIDTKILKEDYPNVFTCYHEDLLMVANGTIFRFPFRTDQFISKLSGKQFTENSIKKLLSDFQREMREMLLFVNNVNTIKVSEIVDGCLKENYSVNVDMSVADNTKRQQFCSAIDNAARKIRESLTPDCIQATEIQYTVKVRDSVGDCSQYLIVNRIGFEGEKKLPDQISCEYKKGNLGLLPRGGVALRIENYGNGKEEEAPGRVFYFLPLPLDSGLPLHINGHFALDHETRRNLWTDDKEGYRSSWNTHLMEAVLVPCYVSALHRMKEILCFDVENTTNAVILRKKLTYFHRYFPDTAKVGISFQIVAFSLYRTIYYNEDDLFPCCSSVTNSDVKLKFYPIVSRKFKFPCVFNTLTKTFKVQLSTVSNVGEGIHERIEHLSQSTKLEGINKQAELVHICKELGIKLLESPKRIMKSMRKSGLKVEELTPEFLISFLKTYDSDYLDKCQIGQLEKQLNQSTFRTVQTLQICIEYCKMSPTFEEQIEGLPICLTNDNVLRPFNTNNLIFFTPYFELLKESSDHFLHESICSFFNKLGIRSFDIKAFEEFLAYTLNMEKYRTVNRNVNWNPNGKTIPSMLWIEQVWKFLSSIVRKSQNERRLESSTGNVNTVRDFIVGKLRPLLPWCLIPCIQMSAIVLNDDVYEHILAPTCQAQFIIDLTSFSGPLATALIRLNLPLLDQDMHLDYDNILEDLVIRRNNPIGFLYVLHDRRADMYSRDIEKDDCIEIMHFFCDHLNSLEKRNDADTFSKLKAIPFHVTVSGQHISIPEGKSVLIIDSITVADGLFEWAMASSTLLIQTTQKLNLLYEKLGYTDRNLNNINLYIKHLLPKFNFLPREHHLVHLQYIKNTLLAKPMSTEFNVEQKDLINVLLKVAFIPDCDGNLQNASFFKDPLNELMRLMLPNIMFPTGVLGDQKWNAFLKLAGMEAKITTDMFLQFARDIELIGKQGITDDNRKDIEDKSKMLLKHVFLEKNIDENLFSSLKQIKFIPPYRYQEDDWKQKICPQPNLEFLVCFSESVTKSQEDLCWTRCPIIPLWAEPRMNIYRTHETLSKMYSLLNIEEPTFHNVVCHVQNVCDALNLLFVAADKQACQKVLNVKTMMSKIYKFLVRKQSEQNNTMLKVMLSKKPIIFLPDQMLFVACENVVKSAKPEEIIHPYLVKAPVSYSEFYGLFEMLGMQNHVNVCSFIHVLKCITNDACNDELHMNELNSVQRTLQNLFKYLQSSTFESDKDKLIQVENLYLPTRDNMLKDAKCLVFSDNEAFEQAIGNDIGMPYVVNLEQFGISISGSFVRELRKLPQHLQPNILSALVKTRLEENLVHMSLDENGEQLSSFLTSPQFHRAILRIAVHSRKQYNYQSNFTEAEVNGWIETIQNIQVIQVESLVLNYLFNKRIVGSKIKTCYYQKKEAHDGRNILFCAFQTREINDWLIENSGTIDYAIRHCTNETFLDSGSLLLKVLLLINDTDRISLLLDRDDIEQYSISSSQGSIFHTLGTAVKPDWHRFLDNSFTTFEVGEYVALLLSENIRSPYIIARIYRRCEMTENADFIRNTLQMYEVSVGNGRIERRPAYDLYKFNRSFRQKSKELSPFIDSACNLTVDVTQLDNTLSEIKDKIRVVWTLPEDERRKIIKRLYKQWHPDKNHGEEKVAAEVFKFIKQAVLDLEQGGNMNDDVNEFNTSSGNSEFWSHFQTWDENLEDDRNHQSNTCEHGRGRQYEPVPSYAEANQWMQQAKRDVAAASQFLEEAVRGHHFNWICFICQQSVEKTLKAMHYQIDSNKIPKSNNLHHLAVPPIDDELRAMVKKFIGIVGKEEEMIYPDRYKLPKIPADEYERHHADKALEITKQILMYVSYRL